MEAMGSVSLARRLFGQEEQVESPNLRDFLRIKEDENQHNTGRTSFSGQTLDSILRLERERAPVRVQSNRTLLDIIRDDPINSKVGKKSWRQFTHRFRVRPQGSDPGPGSSSGSGSSAATISRRVIVPQGSTRFNASSSEGPDPPQAESSSSGIIRREAAVAGGEGEQPVRMSLMALLAETDMQMGFDGSAFVMEMEEEVEEVQEKGGGDRGGEYNCCVCMVRRKGAAFIPCGHTFCRLCCRELWVQRGNCPLCNSLILEILDLF